MREWASLTHSLIAAKTLEGGDKSRKLNALIGLLSSA